MLDGFSLNPSTLKGDKAHVLDNIFLKKVAIFLYAIEKSQLFEDPYWLINPNARHLFKRKLWACSTNQKSVIIQIIVCLGSFKLGIHRWYN